MNQSDIKSVIELLSNAIHYHDWDYVEEALDYILEFKDDDISCEEE